MKEYNKYDEYNIMLKNLHLKKDSSYINVRNNAKYYDRIHIVDYLDIISNKKPLKELKNKTDIFKDTQIIFE